MITSIEAQRAQEREHRGGRAADGMSMPSFASVADLLSIARLPAGPPIATAQPACLPAQVSPPHAIDFAGLLGRSVGTGQCVALVQAADPSLGAASTWQQGATVRGNAALQPGTPIATFSDGRYANATDGSSHAALYLGQDAHGVTVLDQWAGSPAAIRTIPWNNPGAAPANTGDAFRVVRQA